MPVTTSYGPALESGDELKEASPRSAGSGRSGHAPDAGYGTKTASRSETNAGSYSTCEEKDLTAHPAADCCPNSVDASPYLQCQSDSIAGPVAVECDTVHI